MTLRHLSTMMRALAPLSAIACMSADPPGSTPEEPTTPIDSGTDCAYPDAPAEMTEGEPLPMFRWFEARHRDGREAPLRMREVFCNNADDMDWSPFDMLLFVSIPAW